MLRIWAHTPLGVEAGASTDRFWSGLFGPQLETKFVDRRDPAVGRGTTGLFGRDFIELLQPVTAEAVQSSLHRWPLLLQAM